MRIGVSTVSYIVSKESATHTLAALAEAIKADHGFNVDSKTIRDLIDVMSEYDKPTRRACLQFITGSPKLPIGGR
jgi:E3 ubiquitin-protein ligase TRIP12